MQNHHIDIGNELVVLDDFPLNQDTQSFYAKSLTRHSPLSVKASSSVKKPNTGEVTLICFIWFHIRSSSYGDVALTDFNFR
ncbi:hypothetical protein C7W93_08695 [Glaciimonas sp. PCH181]|nr:hypothetical protein C7W93_08695 [Glaciimonas sp. PCH181]